LTKKLVGAGIQDVSPIGSASIFFLFSVSSSLDLLLISKLLLHRPTLPKPTSSVLHSTLSKKHLKENHWMISSKDCPRRTGFMRSWSVSFLSAIWIYNWPFGSSTSS
jgi:hypothetical protein